MELSIADTMSFHSGHVSGARRRLVREYRVMEAAIMAITGAGVRRTWRERATDAETYQAMLGGHAYAGLKRQQASA